MPNYDRPYRGMPGGPGFGQNYSYGQQGSNRGSYGGQSQLPQAPASYGWDRDPYMQGGSLRSAGPGAGLPWEGNLGTTYYNQGQGGYPGQQQRMPQPPAGKGRGMGGIRGGMGGYGGGMMSRQRGIAGDPYRGNDPFQIYGDLMQQRGMEQQLGMDPGAAWSMPRGVPGYERQHSPLWQGLYPGQGGGF